MMEKMAKTEGQISVVMSAVEGLKKNLDEMDLTADELISRLYPVLAPSQPEGPKEDACSALECPLSEIIDLMSFKVVEITRRLQDAIDRCRV